MPATAYALQTLDHTDVTFLIGLVDIWNNTPNTPTLSAIRSHFMATTS